MELTTLKEKCSDWHQSCSVEVKKRLVTRIAITGEQSRNGYSYSTTALQNAVQLYDGKPVFLDHAANRSRPEDRSTRDLVGSIKNPVFENGRIYGDIHVLETESGQTFLKLLELDSPGVGMSHVVKARRSADGAEVEEIVDVISVDAVVNPATTTTFKESITDQNSRDAELLATAEQLREQVFDLQAEQEQLLRENQELKQQLRSVQQKNRVQQLIRRFDLPDQAVTDFFVKQLESVSEESVQEQMVRDRLAIISTTGERKPVVQSESRRDLQTASDDDRFIRLLKQN